MILTAHQPVYLPWLGLFHKIAMADKFCFFDNVRYQTYNWNNRNKIKFGNRNAGWLIVPVLRKAHLERSYLDIEINNALPWQRKHWRSIEQNYSKAPYFDLYAKKLRKFYELKWGFLVDLNYEMLLFFLEVLNISVPVIRMKDYSFKGSKSELVLDMCLQLGASVFTFGKLGENYAEVEAFRRNGIGVYFQDYKHPVYHQQNGPFCSHLSVVDLLFNCGEKSLDILMSGNITRADLMANEPV